MLKAIRKLFSATSGHGSPTGYPLAGQRGISFSCPCTHIPRLRVGLLCRFAAQTFPDSLLKPLRLLVLTFFPLMFAASGLLAGDVGTSKSFHGPVGLVSPYSLRDLQKTEGLAAALDKTRSFGFRYIECGADFGCVKPADFKAELNRRGLVPVGLHFSYEQIRDDVEGVAAAAKVMNVSRIGSRGFPTRILSTRSNAARLRQCSIGQVRRWPNTACNFTTTPTATSSGPSARARSSISWLRKPAQRLSCSRWTSRGLCFRARIRPR